MINILLTITQVYAIGYITTFILMCLGPDEEKAPTLKDKAQWGVFFAIVWPITLPITISCIPHSIISWIKKRRIQSHRKNITRPHHSMYSSIHSPYYKQNLYAKPIPSEIIEDAFDED